MPATLENWQNPDEMVARLRTILSLKMEDLSAISFLNEEQILDVPLTVEEVEGVAEEGEIAWS